MSKHKRIGHHTVTHDIQRTAEDFAGKIRQKEWMHDRRHVIAWCIITVGLILLLIAIIRLGRGM